MAQLRYRMKRPFLCFVLFVVVVVVVVFVVVLQVQEPKYQSTTDTYENMMLGRKGNIGEVKKV